MTYRRFAWLCAASLAVLACAERTRPATRDSEVDDEQPRRADAATPRADTQPETTDEAETPAEPLDSGRAERLDAGPPGVATVTPVPAEAGMSAREPNNDAGSPAVAAGDFAVGTTRVDIATDAGRKLPVQLWYPAVESARAEASMGHPVSEFEAPGPRRELLERLLAGAPADCTNRRMHAAFGAPALAAAAPYPLLVYSHHNEGMRSALFSQAERLARLGFVVAAPDHSDMTLYDRTDDLASEDVVGMALRFRLDALELRAADIESVIDLALDARAEAMPPDLRGKIDANQIGVFGHSMGSMTAGIVAQRDTRVSLAAYLSFPPAATSSLLNLLDQPAIESFRVPALFMLNQEDSPLSAVGGNDAIREQFAADPALAYLVEVHDTGHWSFADDCALIPDFADGCGSGTRHEEPYEAYDNLSNQLSREIAGRYLEAFFGHHVLGRALGPLDGTDSSLHETVQKHAASR